MNFHIRLLFSLIIFVFGTSRSHDVPDSSYCEFYSAGTCILENKDKCITRQKCGSPGPESHNHCFTLWEFNADTRAVNIQMKGCFLNNKDCYEKSHCVQKNKDEINQLYFCCCNGNMCNQNFTYTNILDQEEKVLIAIDFFSKYEQEILLLVLVASVLLFIVTISLITWYFRHRKYDYDSELSRAELGQSHRIEQYPTEGDECSQQQQRQQQQPQQQYSEVDAASDSVIVTVLGEQKAAGRFGSVWKGLRGDDTVAVKVFQLRDRQSWLAEQKIYQLPGMEHDALLRFICAHCVGDGLDAEFWIVTAYHERGSLSDYLAANTVSWEEMHKISESIARGLNHLHEEILPACQDSWAGYKPPLAHRDFKSKNVLLSGDMRACIADFGLALAFNPVGTCGSNYGRVGTLRYMAPEVLDGAINFSKDSFLAIDMYACGLVLWELASRCAIKDNDIGEYKLPFEEEVGSQPTLEEMQDCVALEKRRPRIPEIWKRHPGLSVICDTMEECWDHDAAARISASCVQARIAPLEH